MLKRLVAVSLTVAVLALAGNVGATPMVTLTTSSLRDGSFGGGPFSADLLGNAKNPDFLTFCIEINEHISLPGTYDYSVGMYAVKGGQGGPKPDPLDERTAYLFRGFLNGSLGVDTIVEAQALQEAIWRIEQETSTSWYSSTTDDTLANFYLTESTKAVKDNFYGVQVMNLTSKDSTGATVQNQSMLYVPEPGMFILLGPGLLGLGLLRRRMKKA